LLHKAFYRQHCVAMILSLERWLALTPSVASLQTLTLRSSVRFRGVAPHHRSPTSAMRPAGQDLGAPLAPEINGQYRSNAPECQSFLDNVVAQRHLIAELPRRITRERPVR
jgi:hypothetical protein